MGILGTLNAEKFGTWTAVLTYLQDLNRRETGALAALAAALSASPEEQRELGEGQGLLVLADVAGDQRVQKGPRLAAIRCAIEAGATGPVLATLFLGGGELAADPRLGGTARRLVETGLPAALANPAHESARVSMAAGVFARAVQAAASVLGLQRVKELLAGATAAHAGVNAALFALGQAPLPPAEIDSWKKLLREACAAHKRAPAAARRIGMAPLWPPVLPDAFKELVQDAEQATANVVAIDAAKGGVIKGVAGPPARPGAPATPAAPPRTVANAPPIHARTPRAGSLGAPLPPPSSRPAPPPPSAPSTPPPAQIEQALPRHGAPIKRSPYRRPIGTVVEGPYVTQTRHMEPMRAQVAPGTAATPGKESLLPGERPAIAKAAPLPGLAPLEKLDKGPEFDARGRKIPKVDRWDDNTHEWEQPLLPSSELKPTPLVRAALGPFALRLKSLFEDRPEAVDRLCAAAEARALLAGEEQLQKELAQELALPRWQKSASAEQLDRLQRVAGDESRPAAWRQAANLVLARLASRAK